MAFGVASLILAGALVGAAPNFSAADRTRLDAGEILVKPLEPSGGSGIAVKAAAIIDAPPDRVFEAVDDCAHFHEFMPRTKRSEERSRSPGQSVCFVEVSMPFPLSNLWSETVVRRSKLEGGGLTRKWSLRKGTYNRNTGSWTIFPWGKAGRRSLALYFMDTDPKIPIPDALARAAQSGSLPDIFHAVRKRVVKRP